jgi:transcription antitermination factor NusA-like protein
VSVCIGDNRERLDALKERLMNEPVTIIPWSENTEEYILNSLYPLKKRTVDSIEIDEEQLLANVKVNSDVEIRKALGKGHFNVKLASELTGWVINIQGPREKTTISAPDEELRELINTQIPEVQNKDIEIFGIARIKGIGSKVIVKWKDKPKERLNASQVCRRYNRDIQQDRNVVGEWLYFCEHKNDLKELIVESLYPLEKSDVESIDIDYEEKIATITLTDRSKSSPVWRSQYNIALAEKVTGWKIEIKESHQGKIGGK